MKIEIPNMTKYRLEKFSDIMTEIIPLFAKHYREVAHYQDIKLKPDLEQYLLLCDRGMLKCFTYRCEYGYLQGYAFFFIKDNIHYMESKQAHQDIIFIDPLKRGIGSEFIAWCDQQLKELGCQVVYHHVKQSKNWGKLLERQGYELVDLIFAKRLDK